MKLDFFWTNHDIILFIDKIPWETVVETGLHIPTINSTFSLPSEFFTLGVVGAKGSPDTFVLVANGNGTESQWLWGKYSPHQVLTNTAKVMEAHDDFFFKQTSFPPPSTPMAYGHIFCVSSTGSTAVWRILPIWTDLRLWFRDRWSLAGSGKKKWSQFFNVQTTFLENPFIIFLVYIYIYAVYISIQFPSNPCFFVKKYIL